MIFIGWILFVFGVIRLSVSFVNWVTKPYLPSCREGCTLFGKVSVLIPARDEEANISNLLNDLLMLDSEISEVIVYDDQSKDGTRAIVEEFSYAHPKIKLISGIELKEGWLGKNHACYELSRVAKGDYFLFLDADVKIYKNAVGNALSYIRKKDLKLLSVFPVQIMEGLGSRVSVPLMNWILLTLLPLIAVKRSPIVSLSAANGQFMMFDAMEYRRQNPHCSNRMSAVEDMAIIKQYKKKGLNVATLLGKKDIECKMYDNLRDAIEGFSKNIFQFFGGNALVCFLFGLLTTLAPLFIFIFNGKLLGFIYLGIIVLIRIFVSIASRQSFAWNLLFIIPQQIVLWVIIISAYLRKKKKKLTWKDRNII